MAAAPQPDVSGRRGYPLGTLFVLVAICAVLAAGLAPAFQAVADEKLQWWQPLGAAGIAAFWLGKVGLVAGVLYYPHWRGLAVGWVAGACVGIVAGPLTLVSHRELLPVFLAMCVGTVIAVATAAVMRRKGD